MIYMLLAIFKFFMLKRYSRILSLVLEKTYGLLIGFFYILHKTRAYTFFTGIKRSLVNSGEWKSCIHQPNRFPFSTSYIYASIVGCCNNNSHVTFFFVGYRADWKTERTCSLKNDADRPEKSAEFRFWRSISERSDAARAYNAYYIPDRRRKDGGYDRNFTNTASGRASIAISRLTAPVVSSS